ncbi:6-hydroxy-D-nicotine oxidase [Chaetomium strumarium]|uniref:6-hydroxy-D-nicotine oxidase n=1 Tax=Chaetomium strumarium TaxID=1170767 RepID=A0AAJ0GS28_9PEZI|nr:6-hydroxy-D-nicotine oxidase [Chaetomium strumarium]
MVHLDRWSKTSILSPSCIFLPSYVEDVSAAVKALSAGNCQFAIKSGGHNPTPGANDINDGVSIDLRYLNQTTLAPDRSFVSLGAGGNWVNAYHAFANHGVGFPGGLCGTTGVGGVTIGGGQSPFSAKVGWAVDNVLNFQLVLADGKIVNANATHNSDLFRAQKGGGSNFGVVTRIDMAAFDHSNQLWGGEIVVQATPATTQTALEATSNYTRQNNANVDAMLQTAFFYYSNGTAVIDFVLAATDNATNPEIFHPFTGMSPQMASTVSSRTLTSFVREIIPTQPRGYRNLWATVTFKNNLATLQTVQRITDHIYIEAGATVPDMDWILLYSPQPKAIDLHGLRNGGNVLGRQHTRDDQIVACISPRWLDAAYDRDMYALAAKWVGMVTKATRLLGTHEEFLYLNLAAQFQDPIRAYGEDNVRFIRHVAEKYDPAGVFQRLAPGGFKISRVGGFRPQTVPGRAV